MANMLLALGRPQRQGATRSLTTTLAVSLVWLLALARLADASQWTVTAYYAISITTYSYTYSNYQYTTTRVYTDSNLLSLRPSASTLPASAAVSSITLGSGDEDVETVRIYLPMSVVPSSDISVYRGVDRSSRYEYTYYVQPVAYTAPASCPTPFTVTSSRSVSLPSAVAAQVTPTSTSSTVRDYGDGTLYTTVMAYIDKTYWPTGSSLSRDYTYSYYVSRCVNPQSSSTPRTTSRYLGGGNDSGPGNRDGDVNSGSALCGDDGSGCVGGVPIWGIVLAAVLPSVFLLGFVESFLWFRRLMLGKSAMRFATISWILLCPPIIFLMRRVPPRLVEDQERLREQWAGMGAGHKIRLWAKLGLRHRYPFEVLGEHDNWKPDGYLDESSLSTTTTPAMSAAYSTQPMVQRPQESLQPQVASRGSSIRHQQQHQRRSQSQRLSTGMPTIPEQPRVPPQARLAGEGSPPSAVSSVSDAAPVSEPTPPPMPPRRPDGHSEAGPSNSRPDGGSQA
ncbi:hypothetical protein JDV02_008137 [Purpureocillium takamizusanense]|uniref:Uncharacterized protein n=1 Tax=Purpureocillium takamizusanense TaxID=2060973 RepID=A0A9Q8QMA0_9HYPO|nr:uncharacterized protein JDV02_008137 [Purpureocillium takamizusanense]UNI22230.1 hypothetical protein JDV02_008137 [Purpureocillium takamizusanense]